MLFIEHDMDIVFSISQKVRVLCYGELLADGSPEEISKNGQVIEAYLGTEA
jgi:branched-chain amino acid transport system ATP-binding protein